jgi:hypothetical protein
MMLFVEEDCPKTEVGELPHMNKVHYFLDNMKKLVSVLGYVDETFFERKYGRIAHLIRISFRFQQSRP